jgi:hypothetical protein
LVGAAVDVLKTSDALSSTPFSKILHILRKVIPPCWYMKVHQSEMYAAIK